MFGGSSAVVMAVVSSTFDPTENSKNYFYSIADRPMMTVVTVETLHINKVVHDLIKFTFILLILDRQTVIFLRTYTPVCISNMCI